MSTFKAVVVVLKQFLAVLLCKPPAAKEFNKADVAFLPVLLITAALSRKTILFYIFVN